MTIVDRRTSGKNKSVGNRQRFIKRYKSKIKRHVDSIASEKGITDVLKDRKIVIEDDVNEPYFNFDKDTGEREIVLPGNDSMHKGDRVGKTRGASEKGRKGSNSGDGFDEFTFTLTKQEFLDLYFSGMQLPEFIKESLCGATKKKMKRHGYSKEGVPARLDLLKTLKQAIARRIATSSTRYLDGSDLRYKHYVKHPFPIHKATMILLMDVSGSMGEFEKSLAKKFFLLLYLFLNTVYKEVEVVFIRHTQEAKEVTEQEFFYGTETGGTVVSSGLKLIKDILETRIDLSTTNVYISQASDGDSWEEDDGPIKALMEELLQKVQYFAYIQTETEEQRDVKREYNVKDLLDLYKGIDNKRLNYASIHSAAMVYPVLRSLFEGK